MSGSFGSGSTGDRGSVEFQCAWQVSSSGSIEATVILECVW